VAVYAATETYEADIDEAVEEPARVSRAGPAVG